jgi:hypothetical protein
VRVFWVLALHAFGKSTIALSREALATSLHCSESAAKRAISELAERGHVENRSDAQPSKLLRPALVGILGQSRRGKDFDPWDNGSPGLRNLSATLPAPHAAWHLPGLQGNSDLAVRVPTVRAELGPDAPPEQKPSA